jgi:chemotaxis protein MotB
MARHTGRRKRKIIQDFNNHDRWIVSYADFITLLFAFFVVMYSISSVNEGKYKSLSQSLELAFSHKGKQEKTPTDTVRIETSVSAIEPMLLNSPILLNDPAPPFRPDPSNSAIATFEPAPVMDTLQPIPKSAPVEDIPPPVAKSSPTGGSSEIVKADPLDEQAKVDVEKRRELSEELLKERRQLNLVSDQLKDALSAFIDENLVAVKRYDYWIALEMNSELLFLSGEASLSKKAVPVLKKIAQVINPLPNAINVEGHTDNRPINNLKFPSNWELSSARATSVVQEFVKEGINPTRLSAIGYGEFHPISDNSTEEGRNKNRRVSLVLMSQAFSRYGANDEERAKLLNLAPTEASEAGPGSNP